jgi:asparagine synthase (glutamine-hydrolysing)
VTRFFGIVRGDAIWTNRAAVESEGCCVWFDGFIAGAERLGQIPELLVARSYRLHGPGFQHALGGEYSYCLYDRAQERWILGHDALGLRTAFYTQRDCQIGFASHLEDLLTIAGGGEIDESYVADFIVDGAHYGSLTPYRHIRRLAPGEAGIVDAAGRFGNIVTHRPEAIASIEIDAQAATEELRTRLRNAVRDYLPADGTVLCELSGGLDSSTVGCLAAELAPERTELLSTIFSRISKVDERRWINVVRDRHPLTWHVIDASIVPPFTGVPTRAQAEPGRALLLSGLYEQVDDIFAKCGATAILTGHGGDGVLFGDAPEPFFMADLFPRHPVRLNSVMRDWQRRAPGNRPPSFWFARYVAAPLLRRSRGERMLIARRDRRVPSWIDKDFSAGMDLTRRSARSVLSKHRNVSDSYFWERVRLSVTPLALDLYQRRGISVYRSPLLALPVVEFMASLPPELQLQPDRDRPLQRDALVEILPEQTRLRRGKRGTDAAFHDGLKRSDAWRAILSDRPLIVDRGYVDSVKWRSEVDRVRLGFAENISVFLNLCALEVWLRARDSAISV